MDLFLANVIETALVSGTFLTAFVFVTFMVLRRRKSPADPAELADISARLLRIEQAVDTIAIEMERVSEAQRFTARVLADKGGDAAPARVPPKVVTPH
ncbi:MAG TPA: hypothetical protein VFO55_07245 [Gemmatimonadaceae bacterium]|nr:hypothetical protein [Gemmatimonadaceae bacterium]